MSKATRGTQMLQKSGIDFTVHLYDYDGSADRVGLHAAQALAAGPGAEDRLLQLAKRASGTQTTM